MATDKTAAVNYTPEQIAEMKAVYTAAQTDEARASVVSALAEKLGKSTRSIVAKLSREGVYKAKEYVTKTGEKPVSKDVHADAIGKVLKLTEPETESLTKANKTVLVKIFTALANSVPLESETETDRIVKVQAVQDIAQNMGLDSDEADSLTRVRASVLAKLATVVLHAKGGDQ